MRICVSFYFQLIGNTLKAFNGKNENNDKNSTNEFEIVLTNAPVFFPIVLSFLLHKDRPNAQDNL